MFKRTACTCKITSSRLAENVQNQLLIFDLHCSANNPGALIIFSVVINVNGVKVQDVKCGSRKYPYPHHAGNYYHMI